MFYKRLLLVTICISAVVILFVRFEIFHQTEQSETLRNFVDVTAIVEGKVITDPDYRATSAHVVISVSSVNNATTTGTLLALLPRTTKVFYGDNVRVRGVITTPQTFVTNTGREFDYPNYLRVQGVSMVMSRATVQQISTGIWSIQKSLFSYKHNFEQSLERLLPEPHAALMEGILLGEKHGLPKDLMQAFTISGLVHVVVLSGYNITIVAESIFRVLAFLPRMISFSTGGVMMILFVLMTGGGATTVRACIMAGVALLARYMHRPTVALRSLAFAATAMVLWNPPILLHDPSFILSVLATLGLIMLSPWVEEWIMHYKLFQHKKLEGLRSIIASTIAVQIFVLPALLYYTGILSFLALPANVLALPVIPLAMLSGFLTGILNIIHPLLAFIPAQVSTVLLWWMISIATVTASLPFSSTIISIFPIWLAILTYIPLTAFAISKYRNYKSN